MNEAKNQRTPLVGPRFTRWLSAARDSRNVSVCAVIAATVAVGMAVPLTSASASPGDTHTQAAQKGVDFLTPDVVAFTNNNGCVACHRQGAALYGLSLAKGAGFNVSGDAAIGAPFIAATVVNDQAAGGEWDWGGPNNLKTSYNFYGLAGYDAYVATAYSDKLVKAADWALADQQSDGHWTMDFPDGETANGDVTTTARFMVGISQAVQRVDANKANLYKAALTKGANYLIAHQSDSSEQTGVPLGYELSWAIIGLKAAGYADSDPAVTSMVTMLEARESNAGFAWGNHQGDAPDLFNSGMAIYALCKAGVPAIGNQNLISSLDWVNDQQSTGGSWGSDIDTTFAILGLSCYGDYGVIVNNSGPVTKVISSNISTPQTATYTFDIQNHGFIDDTYNLTVVGGMPGWSASVQPTIAISAGAHATVTLTVNAPPHLPQALPVQMTLLATSQAVPSLSAQGRITTFTDPPPPTSGDSTQVTLTSGQQSSVMLAGTESLSATVKDTTTNVSVIGPGKGVVTFFVAGLAIATDTDADGDGVYTVPFSPDCAFTALGSQDFRAIYSGIDLPAGQTDLLSSLSSSTINLITPACCPKPEICNGQDDDCDGVADNGNPGGGSTCTTTFVGACSQGNLTCSAGGLVCVPQSVPGQLVETCNGVDDDCNGVIDEGFNVGAACTVGVGQCAAIGTVVCKADGSSSCSASPGLPSIEVCGDKVDSDCDGNLNNGCACLADSDCGGPASGSVCDSGAGESFTCIVACRGLGGNGCADGQHCTSQTGEIGQCVACLQDADCGDAASGAVCDTLSNTCEAGCRKSGGNACAAGLQCTSTDATIGTCVGCLADADCGASDSGMVCDHASTSCVDGCRGHDGNGCPGGSVCSTAGSSIGTCQVIDGSTEPGRMPTKPIGYGERSAEQGSTGSGSPSGSGGADGVITTNHWSSNDGTPANSDSPSSSPSGASSFSCSTSPGHDGEGAAWFAAGALGLIVSRRRKSRAV